MKTANARTNNLPRVHVIRRIAIDTRRVCWEDKDRERLNKREFESMRKLLSAQSDIAGALDGLCNRLECIPGGKQRMRMLLGACRAISLDLLGTMPEGQQRQISNTMEDYYVQLVPKATRAPTKNIVLESGIAQGLIDIAQKQCVDCVEDGESCRRCELYMVLESFLPLEDYSELKCPYSLTEWEGGRIPIRKK